MERIEPETEVHRTQKAIKQLLGHIDVVGDVDFAESCIDLYISPSVVATIGGQLTLSLIVNLLARMKSVIHSVYIGLQYGIKKHDQVPLDAQDLREGLENLISSISGSESNYVVEFYFGNKPPKPTLTLAIGRSGLSDDVDILLEADAWTAFVNHRDDLSSWDGSFPVGPLATAVLGAAEVFKRILVINYPNQSGRSLRFIQNLAFSLLTYNSRTHRNISNIDKPLHLKDTTIAGVGAGGSTVAYALACMPQLLGRIVLIDPGKHKKSNLNRYLLSTYDDCTNQTSKVGRALSFLAEKQPELKITPYAIEYENVKQRNFEVVVSTTDTTEARWNLQRDWPPLILDTAVVGTIYAIARIVPETGMCLGCKHPYDPNITMKRIAWMWGKSFEGFMKLVSSNAVVTIDDITLLAQVQGKNPEEFFPFLGVPFNQVPSMSDCGDARFDLHVPNQVASLPFVTTMAGLAVAAELVKDIYFPEFVLNNWFEHNMFWLPKPDRYRYRDRKAGCHICSRQMK